LKLQLVCGDNSFFSLMDSVWTIWQVFLHLYSGYILYTMYYKYLFRMLLFYAPVTLFQSYCGSVVTATWKVGFISFNSSAV
jgi:hypothetical protein